MCGIIGYIGQQDPKGILLEGLRRLEYRGYDSAGIAIVNGERIDVYRCEGRLRQLEAKLGDRTFSGNVGIGHTRWATHGPPIEINAHPHRIGSVALVHNGIIENYADHKENILEMGREITSDTDSEIVAHLIDIEMILGKDLEAAVLAVVPRLQGAFAFVITSNRQPGEMIGVRHGAPLLLGLGEGEYFLASDVQAVLFHTNRIVYLKNLQIARCTQEDFRVVDIEGRTVNVQVNDVSWTPDQLDKAGYTHYMLKEIHEQPRAITNTIEGRIDHKEGVVALHDLSFNQERVKKISRICLVACGTAKHACMVGQHYFERVAGLPVEVEFGSEFRYRRPILDKNTLCVFVSQSGETADTLAALHGVKEMGVPTLSICNVRDSTLARESDAILYTDAGPEIGVASTKAFTTQLTVLYMLALHVGRVRESISQQEARELTNELLHLPTLAQQTLDLEAPIERFCAELEPFSHFFFLGRGSLFPIALEGALKLKEISYLHAEGYPAGELKHGPIALIDRQLITFVLCPRDKVLNDRLSFEKGVIYDKVMANIQEVKARSGKIVAIGTEQDDRLAKQAWFYVGIPSASWCLLPILTAIPLQLFAYHVARLRGTDVDKPRNLAKSVTVE